MVEYNYEPSIVNQKIELIGRNLGRENLLIKKIVKAAYRLIDARQTAFKISVLRRRL